VEAERKWYSVDADRPERVTEWMVTKVGSVAVVFV
jgi:hypothetical protein